MKDFKILVVLIGILIGFQSNVFSKPNLKRYVWDKTPIEITLPVGKRKTIQFNNDVQLLKQVSGISIRKLGDTLYVTALSEFEDKDLYIQDLKNGSKIIITLTAKATSDDVLPVYIQIPDRAGASTTENQSNNNNGVNYISITRYAIQKLFAEERLVSELSSVYRVPMHTARQVSLIYGSNIVSHPIASWTGNGLFVTAVNLKNLEDETIQLDPRASLKGVWKTAVFYPSNTLSARGHKSDTTFVFLTSTQPFVDALDSVKGVYR